MNPGFESTFTVVKLSIGQDLIIRMAAINSHPTATR